MAGPRISLCVKNACFVDKTNSVREALDKLSPVPDSVNYYGDQHFIEFQTVSEVKKVCTRFTKDIFYT